jgi:hypothetical protein
MSIPADDILIDGLKPQPERLFGDNTSDDDIFISDIFN